MKNFILLFLFLLQTIFAQDHRKITFSGGAPLNTYQPKIIIQILTEAFRRNDVTFHAIYQPSLRSLLSSNSGTTDGELHRVYDFKKVSEGKYPNLIRIESELLSIWLSAFATKDININSFDDLKGYHVAYYRGRSNVNKLLAKVLPSESIHAVTTDVQAFKMLAAGRIDIVISESREGKRVIAAKFTSTSIREIAKLNETKIYSYINKRHKSLAFKVAKTIEEMKIDGSFLKIIKNR